MHTQILANKLLNKKILYRCSRTAAICTTARNSGDIIKPK